MAIVSFFHADKGLELQTSRSARILPGWPAAPRKPGPTLDKKKGLLIGNKNQACLVGQDIKQWLKKPVAYIFDKRV
jgi:hypothetical protein